MEEVDELTVRVFDVLAVTDLESILVTSVNEVSGHDDTLDVARLTNGDGVGVIADGGVDEKKCLMKGSLFESWKSIRWDLNITNEFDSSCEDEEGFWTNPYVGSLC